MSDSKPGLREKALTYIVIKAVLFVAGGCVGGIYGCGHALNHKYEEMVQPAYKLGITQSIIGTAGTVVAHSVIGGVIGATAGLCAEIFIPVTAVVLIGKWNKPIMHDDDRNDNQ